MHPFASAAPGSQHNNRQAIGPSIQGGLLVCACKSGATVSNNAVAHSLLAAGTAMKCILNRTEIATVLLRTVNVIRSRRT